MIRSCCLAVLLTLLLCTTSNAATIHVPSEQPTIQAGIDAASDGDTVLVAPGTYLEHIDFLGKTIKVIGEAGADATHLLATQAGPVLKIESGEDVGTEFTGFTISDVNAGFVVVVSGDANPTISECIFHSNNLSHGEEVISCQSECEITRNLFYDNGGISCVGIRSGGGNARIVNNTFDGNQRGFFTVIEAGVAINNIVTNSAEYGIYGTFSELGYNNVWNNNPDYEEGPGPGIEDISMDPFFTDPESNDYTLQASSPCINAGHPDPQYNDPDGTRNDMGAFPFWDWTYPFPGNLTIEGADITHILDHTPTFSWVFIDTSGSQWGYEIEVGTDNDWSLAEMWETGQVVSADTFAVYSGAPLEDGNTYYCRARVSNGVTWSIWNVKLFRMNSLPTVPVLNWPIWGTTVSMYGVVLSVSNSSDLEGDELSYDFEIYEDAGLTILAASQYGVTEQTDETESATFAGMLPDTEYWWQSQAFDGYENSGWSSAESFVTRQPMTIEVPSEQPTIQAGINASGAGDTVLVAPGNYEELLTFPQHQLIITSSHGFNATTLLYPEGAGSPLISVPGADSGSTLSGFTILGMRALSAKIIEVTGITAGFHIERNKFVDNMCSNVIDADGDAVLHVRYNLFSTLATNGNIIRSTGEGCSFINNTVDGGYQGLAIYGNNSLITNNIIVNIEDYAIWDPAPSTVVDYNDFWSNGSQNNPGPHGFSLDPLFRDPANGDYSLSSDSPCIDAGDPDPQFNDPDGSRCDMGTFQWLDKIYPFAAYINYGPTSDGNTVRTLTPEIFWTYLDTAGRDQTGYEVEVGTDLDWSVAEMWDTGPVSSSDTSVIYDGQPLSNNQTYYVRVRVGNSWLWAEAWGQRIMVPRLTGVSFLLSTVPAQNALNVPRSAYISVDFTESMDSTSLTNSTFVAYTRSLGYCEGLIRYDDEHWSATFDPSHNFRAGELVTVTLTTAVRSTEGQPLEDPFTWTFSTESIGGAVAFDSITELPTGDYGLWGVVVAELNGDEHLDIVTSNWWTDVMVVLINNGDSTFAPWMAYPVGEQPRSLCAGDLDGDGDIDIATANYWSEDISVMKNAGDGSFYLHETYAEGGRPSSIIAADVDGDGDLDLITADKGHDLVSVRKNNGNGDFSQRLTFSVGGNGDYPVSVYAADLDNDGALDLITANRDRGRLAVLLNYGDGTFAPYVHYDVSGGCSPQAVVAADLDSDGDADLAVAYLLTSNGLSVLSNNGDGTFADHVYYPVPSSASICAGDIDGDGDQDLISSGQVLLNNGDGAFTEQVSAPVGIMAVSAADMDNDGDLDLVTTGGGSVNILWNRDTYICGDASHNGIIGIHDAVHVISYVFVPGSPAPYPLESGDVDCNDIVDVSDIVYLIAYIFVPGSAPPCDTDNDGEPDC